MTNVGTNASMATVAREWNALLSAHPDIAFLDAALADSCGVLRGKRVAIADAAKLVSEGMAIPISLPLMDALGEMTNAGGHGFSDGDPDGVAWPVAGTVHRVWGASPPRAQMLMRLHDAGGTPVVYDARNVLERVAGAFATLELTPVVALELEFYLLDPAPDAAGHPQPPLRPDTGRRETEASVYGLNDLDRYGGFLTALSEAASLQGVPVSAASSEYGPGQFEANLRHQPDLLRAADHAVLLRQIVKMAAQHHGFVASFMSKPYETRAGCGMHVHVSVLDRNGRNIFDDGTAEGSEVLRHAAGGLAAAMGESMAFFAANTNAYRRFAPDMFAPVNTRLGYNNRSAGLRVPIGPAEARRLEHRCAGADANPYFVLAAVLAGIHHGLANRLAPGPAVSGNVSRSPDPSLPFTLDDALKQLEGARILPGYFGAETLALYRENKKVELQRLRRAITPAEYAWYL